MEFRVERGPGKDEVFLTLVVMDMIGKTNILEVKQLAAISQRGKDGLEHV
jgi:hypothetical protein